jgi:hypothetical protein
MRHLMLRVLVVEEGDQHVDVQEGYSAHASSSRTRLTWAEVRIRPDRPWRIGTPLRTVSFLSAGGVL